MLRDGILWSTAAGSRAKPVLGSEAMLQVQKRLPPWSTATISGVKSRLRSTAAASSTAPAPVSSSATLIQSSTSVPLTSSTAPLSNAAPRGAVTHHIKTVPDSFLSFCRQHRGPSPADLRHASAFFRRAPPKQLYIASSLWQVPRATHLPEVAFLGRSNVGKSTLLNALLAHPICRTSSKPGRTRALHAYAVGGTDDRTGAAGALAVLDVPGYGYGSRQEWETALGRYLGKRNELRRAYVLVDAHHGVKESDARMLQFLRERGVPHQVVLSKIDRVVFKEGKLGKWLSDKEVETARQRLEAVVDAVHHAMLPDNAHAKHHVPALEEVMSVSADMGRYKALSSEPGGTLGIAALRWNIMCATKLQIGKPVANQIPPEVLIDAER